MHSKKDAIRLGQITPLINRAPSLINFLAIRNPESLNTLYIHYYKSHGKPLI